MGTIKQVDTIIDAGWVIPVLPDEKICLSSTSIVVNDKKIIDILPTSQVNESYISVGHHLDRKSSVVIPGLINAHTHAGMTFLRGKADDQDLITWLHDSVWPIEGEFASLPEFCRDGTLLACAEMIRGGVTTFADMYLNAETTAPMVVNTGMRAILGLIMFNFPTGYAKNAQEYYDRGEKVFKDLKDMAPKQLMFAFAPHAPYTVKTEDWIRLRDASKQNGLRIHTHLHETKAECVSSMKLNREDPACHLSNQACTPLNDLDSHELLNDHFIAVHMVHLTDEEMKKCAKLGVHVVHCPTSNAKLASGFCPVHQLIDLGVNVALGTDSACSNNSLDVRAEMKLAALNAKNISGDATVLPASMAIKMATINGAKAFGIDGFTGSLEIGKAADLTIIDVESHVGNSPAYDAHAAVVYASERKDVRDVMCNGKFLLKDRNFCTLDEDDVMRRTQYWKQKILEKFPMKVKKR